MYFNAFFFFSVLVILAENAIAQDARIEVHAKDVTGAVSRYMTGACIEDVNHEIYGGIYSQMIFGESFQEPALQENACDGVSGMWQPIRVGSAKGQYAIETGNYFTGKQSQRMVFEDGQGEIGVANNSLNRWGMRFVGGKAYEGYLWARCEKPVTLHAALQSGDGGTMYAEVALRVEPGDWQRIEFKLTPASADGNGRFALSLREPGSVVLGHVYLEPGGWGRFKGLPVRKDVAEAMVAQGLTVLRYGGSMVNAPEYRWKKMVGPRDRRPPYKGTWYPYSTNGWGIIDFVAFCEAAGFLGIPAFNIDETPEDMADFVEYVNGGKDTPWGGRRVRDGHPEPYRLTYFEFGNEERIDNHYWQRFEPVARAVWAQDPNITIVVGDFAYGRPIEDPFHFKGSPAITSLEAHKKILDFAKENGKEVWFDVHVGTHNPRDSEGLGGIPSFIAALKKLSPGAHFKVAVFELNAVNHAVRRAISNAYAINQLERIGDAVRIVCSANGLQPYKQNDNGWDQGLVFLTPNQVWGQPPYYVTEMLARTYLPQVVKAEVTSPGNALDVTAKCSEDGKVLQLQVVNLDKDAVGTQLRIHDFGPVKPVATVVQLTGGLDDINTPERPEKIAPKTSEWKCEFVAGAARYIFPPYSFTIIRLE